MRKTGMRVALMAGALALAACEETTRAGAVLGGVASGAVTLGGMALGAVTTVAGAGISAAGSVAGAAGSAAAAAVSGGSGAGAAADAAIPAEAGTATELTVAEAPAVLEAPPAVEVATLSDGGGNAAEVLLPASAVAALAALRLLDTAGREALPRAEALRAAEAGEADRCALDLFVAVTLGAGHADGARFAVWLADRAEARGEGDALAGAMQVARGILAEVRAGAAQAELDAAAVLGFEDPARMRDVVGAARDAATRCPAAAARRMAEVMDEEQTG